MDREREREGDLTHLVRECCSLFLQEVKSVCERYVDRPASHIIHISLSLSLSLYIYIHTYAYIYIYIYICTHFRAA